MSNDEGMTKSEKRDRWFFRQFGHSSFIRHSAFGIRHSDFGFRHLRLRLGFARHNEM